MRRLFLILQVIILITPCFAIPVKTYLPVPYLCQAPEGNWGQPWQDACEEAVIIMAMNYVQDRKTPRLLSGQAAGLQDSGLQDSRLILDLVEFQVKRYGGHYDLTAQQMVQLIKDYYKYDQVEIKTDPLVQDIKQALAAGQVVIAPMAGRLLHNPFYTPPGPAYHAMLFKGYDDRTGEFITNDAGTKHGRNYRYKYELAYNAIHDWTGSKETILQGKKVVIVIKSN